VSISADAIFGVALPAHGPVESAVATAVDAEELGYGVVWITDDRLQRDVFEILTAVALRTSRVRLGPGVVNPYSRHPALIATAIATLDEVSDGRAVLGIGAGGTNHRALGVTRKAPVTAVREAISIVRGLLAGEEVTLTGKVVRAQQARLDFTPVRPHIPIYVGTRGPLMLELAGAEADGVIVGNVASSAGWRYAVEHIKQGAALQGRELSSIAHTAWVYCCIADDPSKALDAIRPNVATSLATSRSILPSLGIELPQEYEQRMTTTGWSLDRDAVRHAGDALPVELLRWFALAGTPAECATALQALHAEYPQISEIVIVPAGDAPGEVVRRFALEVAPALEVSNVG
jgi:5,10-methylenetetrahydromethanopterin reductase